MLQRVLPTSFPGYDDLLYPFLPVKPLTVSVHFLNNPAVEPLPSKQNLLQNWVDAEVIPITQGRDPVETMILEAIRQEIFLFFQYPTTQTINGHALTTIKDRIVFPRLLFQKLGYCETYLQADCHLRGESRTFRLDKIIWGDIGCE